VRVIIGASSSIANSAKLVGFILAILISAAAPYVAVAVAAPHCYIRILDFWYTDKCNI
jgi:hypothetical protein